MNSNDETIDWQRILAAFHGALEHSECDRESWLAGADQLREAERDEVRALLRAHAAKDTLLDRRPALDTPPGPGEQLGPWRLLDPLGRGGGGTVYLAERCDGTFERRVAIKFFQPLLFSGSLRQAFDAERRILASLDHPGIVRLLDAGDSDSGWPYLVMEHVDGATLDRWCRLIDAPNDAMIAVRLNLFRQICAAVEYAHRMLVVHGDLKPENILVEARGDRPRARLLDFGIARLLEHQRPPAGSHSLSFTPASAAPEQWRGEPPSVATDVHALGLLLCEILTGRNPFADLPEHAEARLVAMQASLPTLQARSRCNAVDASRPAARHRLPRELDWILARCLAFEPGDRYPGVGPLLQDLDALREHRPVRARPTGPGYPIGCFIRRHWSWLSATAIGVAGLMALVVLLTLSNQRVDRALATSERNLAQAESTVAFLTRLFALSDRTRSGGEVPDALEILERGRDELAQDSGLQAELRLPLLLSLARIHANLGENTEALALARQAQGLIEEDPGRAAEVGLEIGRIQFQSGQLEASRGSLNDALAALDADPATARSDGLRARIHLALGTSEQHLGRLESAGREFHAAAALAEARPDPGTQSAIHGSGWSPDLPAEILLRLGSWEWSNGNLDAAAAHYRHAIDILQALGQRYLPERARAIDAHASALYAQGRYAPAAEQYRDAVELRRRVLGDHHQHTADSLSNLGAVHYEMGNDGQAEPALREARAIYTAQGGGDHQALGKILNNLGLVRLRLGDLVEAEALFEQALELHRETLGPVHAKVAGNLNNLGLVAERRGDLRAADGLYREAQVILREQLGPAHPALAYSATNRARIALLEGRHAEADEGFDQALELRRSALGEDHPATASSQFWSGISRCIQGRHQPALQQLELSLGIRRKRLGDTHPDTLIAAAALARCSERAGLPEHRDRLGIESWSALRPRLAPGDPATTLLDSLK